MKAITTTKKKTFTFKKKALSVALSSLLFAQPLLAISSDDLKKTVMSNTTASGKYHSNGVNYYSGGSLVFRFKNEVPYRPIFAYRPPTLKAGCNGLSLDMGFMSIMDLDEISKQLEQAGTSLMWGILAGIMYSLPTVGEIFKFIQDIVQKIQYLLQNACNIGKQWGKQAASGVASAISDNVDMGAFGDDMKKGISWMRNGSEGQVDKWANAAKNLFTSDKSNSDVPNYSSMALSSADLMKSHLFSPILGMKLNYTATTNEMGSSDYKNIIENGGTFGDNFTKSKDLTTEDKLKLFMYNYLGLFNVIRDEKVISDIGAKANIEKMIKEQKDPQEIAKLILSFNKKVSFNPPIVSPDTTPVADKLDNLLDIFDSNSSKTITIDNYNIDAIPFPIKSAKTDKSKQKFNIYYMVTPSKDGSKISVNFNIDLAKSIRDQINNYIKGGAEALNNTQYSLPQNIKADLDKIKTLQKTANYKDSIDVSLYIKYAINQYKIAFFNSLLDGVITANKTMGVKLDAKTLSILQNQIDRIKTKLLNRTSLVTKEAKDTLTMGQLVDTIYKEYKSKQAAQAGGL